MKHKTLTRDELRSASLKTAGSLDVLSGQLRYMLDLILKEIQEEDTNAGAR